MAERTSRHVALLRAINVGGRNKLPMAELRALFEQVGCQDVRTYIQSGNVAYRVGARLAGRIPELVGAAIEEAFGFRPPIVTRTAEELRAVAAHRPYPEVTELKFLQVAFLAEAPAQGAQLDPSRSPDDRFEVRGREVLLHYPNGTARSKLTTGYIERALGTTCTLRNWRTVGKIAALVDE